MQSIYDAILSGHDNEAFKSLIYEIDPSCMKILDEDGRVLAINQAGLDMIHADSRDSVIGKCAADLLSSAQAKLYMDMLRRTLAGETTDIEFEITTMTGEKRWFKQRSRSHYCEGSRKDIVFAITRDITEDRLNKERLDLAISVTNQGLWDELLVADHIFYNSNWYTMLGYAPGELPMTSETWRHLVHPDDIDQANAEFRAHSKERVPTYNCEYRMRTKSGNWKWIRDVGRIVARNEDGTPLRAIGLHIDIDATKRHELTLSSVVASDTVPSDTPILTELCRSIADGYEVDSVGVARLIGNNKAEVIAGWSDGRATSNFTYSLIGTPCDVASKTGFCHYHRGICTHFPEDTTLADMNAVGYAGLSLVGSDGSNIGILYVISKKTLQYTKDFESTIMLVGARAATELERLSMTETLHESENRLKLAMNSARFGYWDWNAATQTVYFSDEIYRMLGYDSRDHQDPIDWWKSICHPDDINIVQQLGTHTASRGSYEFDHELRLKQADGTWRWFRHTGRLVSDNNSPELVRIVGLLTDNHSQKLNQLELYNTKSLLEETGKMAKVGGWELLLSDNTIRWTDQTYIIHGLEIGTPVDLDQAIGFYTEQSRKKILEHVKEGIDNGTPWDLELKITTASNREIWVRTTGALEIVDGVKHRLYGTFQDINDSKVTLTNLEYAKNEAESASRAKSEFLANMSHEIRTPMTAILGNSDLLLHNSGISHDPEFLDNSIKAISRNANHLMSVINDILDTSKIEAGMLKVEQIEISPYDLISESVEMLSNKASDKNIHLSVEFVDELPRSIESDPTRIRQILINLVGNAIKFTDSGSVNLQVGYNPLPNKFGLVTFRVVDTGIGISDENLASLLRFEAFHQADTSTTRKYGGTGLGLRITNALVEILGGKLTCTSELGVGTTVTATIQVNPMLESGMWKPPAKVAAREFRDAESSTKSVSDILSNKKVMLVEDGEDNQILISYMLRTAGINVIPAVNGADAIRVYQDHLTAADSSPFDLVLMDMQMPEIDGYNATSALRDLGFTGPIIALTAHAMAGDRDKCLAAGCQDYLTKPAKIDVLLETCAKHIGFDCAQSKSA